MQCVVEYGVSASAKRLIAVLILTIKKVRINIFLCTKILCVKEFFLQCMPPCTYCAVPTYSFQENKKSVKFTVVTMAFVYLCFFIRRIMFCRNVDAVLFVVVVLCDMCF